MHFALFVSAHCHGDNGTRVTAQPAPRVLPTSAAGKPSRASCLLPASRDAHPPNWDAEMLPASSAFAQSLHGLSLQISS